MVKMHDVIASNTEAQDTVVASLDVIKDSLKETEKELLKGQKKQIDLFKKQLAVQDAILDAQKEQTKYLQQSAADIRRMSILFEGAIAGAKTAMDQAVEEGRY